MDTMKNKLKLNTQQPCLQQSHFFSLGVQEIECQIRSSGCKDEFVFVEFESFSIKLLMISELSNLALRCKGKKIALISSTNLLPLAYSYVEILGPQFCVFDSRCTLSHLILQLTRQPEIIINPLDKPKTLSIEEMFFLEFTLQGNSAVRIGKKMNFSIKKTHRWRNVIEGKLRVRKIRDIFHAIHV